MGYKDFWWASALSRMDTRDAISNIQTRSVPTKQHPTGELVTGVPPEEVTTFNLIRRLVDRRTAAGGRAMALHSRPLEGGDTSKGRPPSGADLEIAVEVTRGRWVDFALQAKKFHPPSGTYRGWNPTQNTHLITWSATNDNRTPGMLLYNIEGPPFAHLQGLSPLFGGCCQPDKKCHGWKWPGSRGHEWSLPDERTPMAVSLVLDQNLMTTLTNPTPTDLQEVAFPLECIFCPKRKLTTRSQTPGWAAALLEPSQPTDDVPLEPSSAPEDPGPNAGDLNDQAGFSVVLGIGLEEEDD